MRIAPSGVALAALLVSTGVRAEERKAAPDGLRVGADVGWLWSSGRLSSSIPGYSAAALAPEAFVGFLGGPIAVSAFGRLAFPSSTSAALGIPYVDAYFAYGLRLEGRFRVRSIEPFVALGAGRQDVSAAPVPPPSTGDVPSPPPPVPDAHGVFGQLQIGFDWAYANDRGGTIGPVFTYEVGPVQSELGRGSYRAYGVALRLTLRGID